MFEAVVAAGCAVAMKLNLDQLPAVVRLVAELGADELCVSDMIEYPGLEGQSVVNDPEWAGELLGAARRAAAELQLELSLVPALEALLPSPGPRPQERPARPQVAAVAEPAPSRRMVRDCRDPWEVVFVQATGEIMPCCFLPMPMGDLGQLSLDQIWRAAQYRMLRRFVASSTALSPCASCFVRGWKQAPDRPARQEIGRPGHARVEAPGLAVEVETEREAYRSDERARVAVTVRAHGATDHAVDVYLGVDLPDGGRIWIDCNGLTDRRQPIFAAWEPFELERFCVFVGCFPRLAVSGDVTLTLEVVSAGLDLFSPIVRIGRAQARFLLESPDAPLAPRAR